MSEPQSNSQSSPPILTYDREDTHKSSRARTPLPGYSAGLLLALLLLAVLCFLFNLTLLPDQLPHEEPFRVLVAVFVLWLFDSFLATLFLGITMWIRQKLIRDIAFASFRKSMYWGFVGGLFPLLTFNIVRSSPSTAERLALAALLWHTLIPLLASFFLCHRSHLRD